MKNTIVLLVCIMFLFNIASLAVKAEDEQDYIMDTFEDYVSEGASIRDGWRTSRGISNDSFTASEIGGARGKALSVSFVGKNFSDMFFKFDTPYKTGPGSGYLTINYDFMLPCSDTTDVSDYLFSSGFLPPDEWLQTRYGSSYESSRRGLIISETSPETRLTTFVGYLAFYKTFITNAGNYGYYTSINSELNFSNISTGSTFNLAGVLEKMKWYTVETIVNLNMRTATLYLDGVKYAENVPFGNAGSAGWDSFPIDGFGFEMKPDSTTDYSGMQFYIDNFYVEHFDKESEEIRSFVSETSNVSIDSKYIDVSLARYFPETITKDKITITNTKTGDTIGVTDITGYDHRNMRIHFETDNKLDFLTKYKISFGSNIKDVIFETEVRSMIKYYLNDNFEEYISNSDNGYILPKDWENHKETDDIYNEGQIISTTGNDGGVGLELASTEYDVGIRRSFETPIPDLSTFTIEFDMLSSGGGMQLYLLPSEKLTSSTIIPFAINATSSDEVPIMRSANNRTNIANREIGLNYNEFESWVHVDICVKMEANDVTIIYKVGNSSVTQTAVVYKIATDPSNPPLIDVGGIAFSKLQGASDDEYLRLDNIKVYKGTSDKPEKSKVPYVQNIIFEKYDGATTSNLASIPSVTEKIHLSFNTNMNKEDLESAITLTTVNGENVNYTLLGEGFEFYLYLDNMLMPKTNYNLHIDQSIRSEDDIEMDEEYYTQYTTLDDGSFLIKEIEIKKGTNEVNPDALYEGDTLIETVTFVKTNNESKKFTLFYFDYNADEQNNLLHMNNASYKTIIIGENNKGIISVEMPIVVKNAGDISTIKGFVWEYPSNRALAECEY